MKTYLFPFSNIYAVSGYKQGILCDSQRKKIDVVPKSFVRLFKELTCYPIKEIEQKYQEDISTLKEYEKFLLEKEYAFITTETEINFFPDKSLSWDYPSLISNAIIDIDLYSKEKIINYVKQLDEINCKNLQFRFLRKNSLQEISDLMSEISDFSFQTVDLVLNYEVIKQKLNCFTSKYSILGNLVLYNSDEENTSFTANRILIIKTLKKEFSVNDCGVINNAYFVMNDDHFAESQHYNTCLNRKISIDAKGEIKNCPSMKRSFGNIKDISLAEALEKPGFKDLWTIKKDDIDVCKDCEFRHICTDCRAFIKNPENIYSQPAKCPYNPYIAKWEGQEGYITVEQWRENNENQLMPDN